MPGRYRPAMELRHLRYFAAVAELRSVSKAAGVVRITQPSLSRQIMELERKLGYALFRRTARGVDMTPAGTGLYRYLPAVFAHLERIPEVVRTAAETKELVTVGVPQGLPHEWFLELVEAIEEQLPNLTLSLHEATTDEQRQLLQKGLLDLALLHLQAPESHSLLLLQQPMGIAVAQASPLAERSEVQFSELNGLTVMAHAVGEIATEELRLRSASAAAGVDTQWVFRRFSEHSWLIARTAKVDAVLLTQASAARHLPDWAWIPMIATDEEGQSPDIRTWATWSEPTTPVLRELLDVIKEVVAQPGSTEEP